MDGKERFWPCGCQPLKAGGDAGCEMENRSEKRRNLLHGTHQ